MLYKFVGLSNLMEWTSLGDDETGPSRLERRS
jgi:hypothetical protein